MAQSQVKGLALSKQATSPFPELDEYGIWLNTDGELVQQMGLDPAINITQSIASVSAPNRVVIEMANSTGGTLTKGSPISVNTSGAMQLTDIRSNTSARSCIGVLEDDVANGASGYILVQGRLENFTTSAGLGNVMYVSSTSTLINVTDAAPVIGSDGYLSGDHIIRIGVVLKNLDNPSNKDLVVNTNLMGQL